MKNLIAGICMVSATVLSGCKPASENNWIRINQLGYLPDGIKTAVWCSKENKPIASFELIDSAGQQTVFTGKPSPAFGSYGPFQQTQRLDFSAFTQSGSYFLRAGKTTSPLFRIDNAIYKGAADFCLRYMRQQRSGFNPFLKDSCHTKDGFTLYGESAGLPDSTHIDATGGWHDASDYLQYSATTANATYHLLMAFRDFPQVFADEKLANGLDGKNHAPDVLDEAKWGLDWLVKMNPRPDQMFNQLGDDRDHIGFHLPKLDSQYGKGFERPVYFITGEKQRRQKFMNNTTGTSSTAAKFSSAFSLGSVLFQKYDKNFAALLANKAPLAFRFAERKPGASQTVSVKEPYIYAEDNWADDMEVDAGAINDKNQKRNLDAACKYALQEPLTPWLGADTAAHYQWYPFINLGHYELAKRLTDNRKDTIVSFYKEGVSRVWNKAKQNAFYRGVPFIWCSNNLTVSFAIQCFWYRQLTGDLQFTELEQANMDWLFGCNPWGTSMVYGLPNRGDTPVDPHSAFSHLKNYPLDGGLIDGPIYAATFNKLLGLKLHHPDSYAPFQSSLAVYHDDWGDYSTNEPTMDGTASLIYLLAAMEGQAAAKKAAADAVKQGAITRADATQKILALVFTGHEFADGGNEILQTLREHRIKASFFFTGDFYRNKNFHALISQLKKDGHYLGAPSDKHLLYAAWENQDSLLVTKLQFKEDLLQNYSAMKPFGIAQKDAGFFLPPFEWHNSSISSWTKELGLQLINYTPGTLSFADYTWPELPSYKTSAEIFQSIIEHEQADASGLNGFLLLSHIGADPRRTDKFYRRLPSLLSFLAQKGYRFKRVDELLDTSKGGIRER